MSKPVRNVVAIVANKCSALEQKVYTKVEKCVDGHSTRDVLRMTAAALAECKSSIVRPNHNIDPVKVEKA